jgi:Zn-dependent peptidase ImmA (M78 family)/DNA-binding XRE family transcriptional regulator
LDTNAVVAVNVRTARERFELTQDEVAKALGIARSAVSDIESGKRQVSASELVALSRVLGQPMDALVAEAQATAGDDLVLLRASAVGPATRAQLERWTRWAETYRELEECVDEARAADLRPAGHVLSTFEHAHRLADEERKRLDLGHAPGHQLLSALEERVGVKVAFMDLDDSLSGASMTSARSGASIVVNRQHVAGRRAFTLAHEYFHLLTHGRVARARGEQPLHVCEAQAPDAPKDRGEQLADQFAGRLLLPPEHFIERLQLLRKDDGTIDRADLVGLARYFGVSVQAVFVQLAVQRLVSWDLANAAYRDPVLSDRIVEYAGAEGEEPSRFRRLAVKAFLAECISRERLAELLEVNLADVEGELGKYGAQGEGGGVRVALPA